MLLSKLSLNFFLNYCVQYFSVHKVLTGLDILLLYRRRRLKENTYHCISNKPFLLCFLTH